MLGHSNAGISKSEGIGGLIGDDFNFEAGLILNDVGVSEGAIPDLIEGIGGIGDELSEEDFFVGVEGVDDEAHQLLDVSIEGKVLSIVAFWGLTHFYFQYYI